MGLLVRRAIVALVSAGVTVTGLVVLLAAIALRVDWDVPEPVALTGPTVLLDAHGEVLARFTAEVDRQVVPLDQVAPVVTDAVVAAEDARFYEHDGVDPLSLVRAVISNVRTGGISQGGSTLTQQYVKNAFVGDEQTVRRKVREAVVAIALERSTSKEEILERYLNAVPFGEGAHGIEAAARTYFGVAAADLDAAQAATLAQTLPAPSVRNPRSDPEGARARRDVLLARMGELGSLTPEEVRAAQATPLEVAPRPQLTTTAPAFVGYVRRQIEHVHGPDAVLTGALTVRTTHDPDVQQALDAAIADVLPAEEAGEVEAAAVALDPRSGAILAIHGGRDLRLGDLDLATMTRRQNGSSFKPFVYAAALEEELVTPTTRLPAPGRVTIDDCVDHDGGPISVRGGPGGQLSVHEALVRSANTTFQLLGCELGGPRIVEQAQRLGVASEVGTEAAVALGGSSFGASVLDMASAFGTFANDGLLCPARSIAEVRDIDGAVLEDTDEVVVIPGQPRTPRRPDPETLEGRPDALADRDADGCHGVLDARTAREVTAAMQDVVARGTGRAADIGRPQAGKTGTTSDNKDAWFVGVTPELALAVWVGDPGGEDGQVAPLSDLLGLSEVTGGSLPAAIWAAAAERALADVEPSPFPRVEDVEEEDDGAPLPGPREPVPDPPAPSDPSRQEPDDGSGTDGPGGGEEPPGSPTEPDDGAADDGVADDGAAEDGADGPGEGEPPPEDDDEDRCLLVLRC